MTKLLPKHRAVAYKLAKGLSQADAYSSVYHGCARSTAVQRGHKLANRPEIKEIVAQILAKNEKSSLDNVVRHITNDLNAKKELPVGTEGVTVKVRDNTARQNAQEKLLKLHQAPGFAKETNINIDQRQQSLYISEESIEKLGALVTRLEEMNNDMDLDECLQSGEVVDI